MANRPANPREIREANARYAYDCRNHGAGKAADAMFARNAERRKIAEKDAVDAMKGVHSNIIEKTMRELYRHEANSAKE